MCYYRFGEMQVSRLNLLLYFMSHEIHSARLDTVNPNLAKIVSTVVHLTVSQIGLSKYLCLNIRDAKALDSILPLQPLFRC